MPTQGRQAVFTATQEQFLQKANADLLKNAAQFVTKYLITEQTPAAGARVWPGTVIHVELAAKESLSTGAFDMDPAVKGKYKTVGEALVALKDDSATRFTAIAGENKSYVELTAEEKKTTDFYLESAFGSSADKSKIYEDLRFLVNM